MTSRVRRRPRLGGLLNFYERAAVITGSAEKRNITGLENSRYRHGLSGQIVSAKNFRGVHPARSDRGVIFLRTYSEPPTFVVAQPDTPAVQLRLQYPVLFPQEFAEIVLFPFDSAEQRGN